MAGDWIKVQANLPDKPEVWHIAKLTGIEPDAVTGKLVRVWAWFDAHTTDGNAVGVTVALLDRLTCVTDFGVSMLQAGWLVVTSDGIALPNFDRHNGETAKTRALGAKRAAKSRAKAPSNAERNAGSVTKSAPREEKRREDRDKDISDPPKTAGSATKKPRPRNELFDALAEVTGLDPATAGPRIGTAAALMAKASPAYTPDEVREFARRFWELCPWAAEAQRQRPTPHEVANHIGLIRAGPAPTQSAPARRNAQTDYAIRTALDAAGFPTD